MGFSQAGYQNHSPSRFMIPSTCPKLIPKAVYPFHSRLLPLDSMRVRSFSRNKSYHGIRVLDHGVAITWRLTHSPQIVFPPCCLLKSLTCRYPGRGLEERSPSKAAGSGKGWTKHFQGCGCVDGGNGGPAGGRQRHCTAEPQAIIFILRVITWSLSMCFI